MTRLRTWLLGLVCIFYAVFVGSAAIAQGPALEVRRLLSLSDSELSYERSKLALDRIIAPVGDEGAVAAQIDRLAAQARRIAAGGNDIAKLQAVRQVIYEAGAWNGNQPFAYDHDDPYGTVIRNKLLATYLQSRRGNCVSMPILHLIVAERLGLNVSLSTAPLHVFMRYTNPTNGRSIAIEPTSGGHPAREEWYREKMAITEQQMESGIYLGQLTKRESIALMANTVVEWLIEESRYQDAIDVADVILEHYPKDVHTLVARASAHGGLLETEFMAIYRTPAAIPASLQPRYRQLAAANAEGFAKAESWGWTPTE
jgi:regulator of sirC expression with transglutaminase-like and TPR domain